MRTLLLLAALTSVAAADAKYTRPQPKAPVVKLSDRTKPIVAAELPPAGPTVTAKDVLLLEEEAMPYRVEQEGVLEQLVKQTPDDDLDKPELLFRLAEHYARQQRFWRLKSIELTIKAN